MGRRVGERLGTSAELGQAPLEAPLDPGRRLVGVNGGGQRHEQLVDRVGPPRRRLRDGQRDEQNGVAALGPAELAAARTRDEEVLGGSATPHHAQRRPVGDPQPRACRQRGLLGKAGLHHGNRRALVADAQSASIVGPRALTSTPTSSPGTSTLRPSCDASTWVGTRSRSAVPVAAVSRPSAARSCPARA